MAKILAIFCECAHYSKFKLNQRRQNFMRADRKKGAVGLKYYFEKVRDVWPLQIEEKGPVVIIILRKYEMDSPLNILS